MNKLFCKLTLSAVLVGALLIFNGALITAHPNAVEIDDSMIHEYLIESFGYEFVENYFQAKEMVSELYDGLPVSRMGDVMYPAYFGGMYINDDGELVILQVTDATLNEHTTLDTFEDAVFKSAEFSYRELNAVMDLLNWRINGSEANASAWSLDVINNRVVVQLINYGADEIAEFRNTILDSPMVIFEEGEVVLLGGEQVQDVRAFANPQITPFNMPPFSTTRPSANQPIIQNPRPHIRTGDQIWFYRSGRGWLNHLSVGYRASNLDGRLGFVSAAHRDVQPGLLSARGGLQAGDIVTNHQGIRIGVVQRAQLQGLDAVFVVTDAGVVINSHGPLTYDGIIVGQLVLSRGSQSGYQFATISNANTSALVGNPLSNIRIDQGIRADINLIDGDSGGVVYTVTVNPTTNMAEIRGVAGINIAGNGFPLQGLFSRADAINRAFSLRLR